MFLKQLSKILLTIRVIRLGTCVNSYYLLLTVIYKGLEGNNVILSYSRRSREPIKKGRATLRVNMTKLPVDESLLQNCNVAEPEPAERVVPASGTTD